MHSCIFELGTVGYVSVSEQLKMEALMIYSASRTSTSSEDAQEVTNHNVPISGCVQCGRMFSVNTIYQIP